MRRYLVALTLLAAGCAGGPNVRLISLADSIDPFVSRFNAGSNAPQVVALFSPT